MNDHDCVYLTQLNSSYRWSLLKEKVFTIGRALTNSIVISSPYVSRQQCTIKFENSSWTIFEQSSIKTTCVNGVNVKVKAEINDGDIISFSSQGDGIQLKFTHYEEPLAKRALLSPQACADANEGSMLNNDSEFDAALRVGSLEIELDVANKRYEENVAVIENMKKEILNLKEKNLRLENDVAFYQSLFNNNKGEIEKLNRKISDLNEELLHTKQLVVCERSELNNFKVNLKELKEQLEDAESEIDALVKATKDPGYVFEAKIEEQSGNFEIASLRKDLALMTDKFQETSKLLVDSLDEKDKFKESVVQVINTDLMCSVCQDFLVKATTLSCMHSFCNICIVEWTKRKCDCPVCRTSITARCTTIVIDTVIDNLIELIGEEELKEKRRLAKQERNMVVSTYNSSRAAPANARVWRGRGGRRRGGGGRRRQVNTLEQSIEERIASNSISFMELLDALGNPPETENNAVQVISSIVDLTADEHSTGIASASDLESLSDMSLVSYSSDSSSDDDDDGSSVSSLTTGSSNTSGRGRNAASPRNRAVGRTTSNTRSGANTRAGAGTRSNANARGSSNARGQSRNSSGNSRPRRQSRRGLN